MQDALPAVCFIAALVIILYVLDSIVQWRNTSRSRVYPYLQLFLIMLFVAGYSILLIKYQTEATQSFLYGLQGLSLLQSLIIEAMISSRLYLGPETYFDRRRSFPWVHALLCATTLIFCLWAFIILLHETDDRKVGKGHILLNSGTTLAHLFLVCLTFQQYKFSGISAKRPTFLSSVLYVSFIVLVVNSLFLLLPDITSFLLGQTISSFCLNTLWVGLTTYNFEWRNNKRTQVQGNNQPSLILSQPVTNVNANSTADIEIQTQSFDVHEDGSGQSSETWV